MGMPEFGCTRAGCLSRWVWKRLIGRKIVVVFTVVVVGSMVSNRGGGVVASDAEQRGITYNLNKARFAFLCCCWRCHSNPFMPDIPLIPTFCYFMLIDAGRHSK